MEGHTRTEKEVKRIPIAEVFDSIQGEGRWVGTRMMFVRTAGCSVGRPVEGSNPHEQCCTVDGRMFMCDTDFRRTKMMIEETIIQSIPVGVSHACITGGEPLDHNLYDLIILLLDRLVYVHIETSGTKYPVWLQELDVVRPEKIWVTCSPKIGAKPGMIERANEIKLLVDADFKMENVPKRVQLHQEVYLQAIEDLDNEFETIKNKRRVLDIILKQAPNWKVSTQMHKQWRLR